MKTLQRQTAAWNGRVGEDEERKGKGREGKRRRKRKGKEREDKSRKERELAVSGSSIPSTSNIFVRILTILGKQTTKTL